MKDAKLQRKEYYVGIKDSKEIRRSMLESSKLIVLSMQSHQKIAKIRKDKQNLKEKLREDAKELKMLFSRLEKLMPEHAFEDTAAVKAEKPQPQKMIKKDPAQNEIDRLHAHLSIIESRLKAMK